MSAKKAKKPEAKGSAAASASTAPAPHAAPAAVAAESPTPSWLDSSDPRKRRLAQVVFAAVWIYVGALWLLALDQTFGWGIFGPKIPPT